MEKEKKKKKKQTKKKKKNGPADAEAAAEAAVSEFHEARPPSLPTIRCFLLQGTKARCSEILSVHASKEANQ